mmetsp:Transcript_5206/g.15353  ORF Transcript_5206/g.15353 Transcript_5206/m.15353 type:complete len:506 (+) Transcript_5206:315-1832(+)
MILPSRCHSVKQEASRALPSVFALPFRMNFEYSSMALFLLSLCACASTARSHSKRQPFQASTRTILSFRKPMDASTFACWAFCLSAMTFCCRSISWAATSCSRWLSASSISPRMATLHAENVMLSRAPELWPAIIAAYFPMRLSACDSTLLSCSWTFSSSDACAPRICACSFSVWTVFFQPEKAACMVPLRSPWTMRMSVRLTAFRLFSASLVLAMSSCHDCQVAFSSPFRSPANHCSSIDLVAWCALAARFAACFSSSAFCRSCSACIWACCLAHSCCFARAVCADRSVFSDSVSAFQFLKPVMTAAFLSPASARISESFIACMARPFFLDSEAALLQAWIVDFRVPFAPPISHFMRIIWTTESESFLRCSSARTFSRSAASNSFCCSASVLLSCSRSLARSSCLRACELSWYSAFHRRKHWCFEPLALPSRNLLICISTAPVRRSPSACFFAHSAQLVTQDSRTPLALPFIHFARTTSTFLRPSWRFCSISSSALRIFSSTCL